MVKKWITDVIDDDYKKWKGEKVILSAGTGCGKTTFCLEILAVYAKSVGRTMLYLCNRDRLKAQVEQDVRKLGCDNVTVTTYQCIQDKIIRKIPVERYDYILADECHYFTTDALFNEYTDLAYNYTMNATDSVVVYMSATANVFFNHMLATKKVRKKNMYTVEKDYSYVNNLYVYKKKQLPAIIDRILAEEEGSKIVVFCNSESRMMEMYDIYRDRANYYCSKHTKSIHLKEICSDECFVVNEAFDLYTFDKRILFTTSALDNGVNLKDRSIRHIFSELFDVDTMIQALGRKRSIDEDDTCDFYIKEFSPQAIQGMLNQNKYQLDPVRLYLKDYKKFCRLYGEEKSRDRLKKQEILHMYFTEKNGKKRREIHCNMMRYNKYCMDNNILQQMKENGYIATVLNVLGEELSGKMERVDIYPPVADEFLEYLKCIEGKPLFAEEREELKTKIGEIGFKLRRLGINTFNGILADFYENEYTKRFYNKDSRTGKYLVDYRRVLSDGVENPNRNKQYWILQ